MVDSAEWFIYHVKDVEIAYNYKDFWDENNLQVLCRSCNIEKEHEFRKQNNIPFGVKQNNQ